MNKFFLAILLLLTLPVQAGEPIIVGQVVEKKAWPEIGINHDRGVELAVSEINAAGGVKGRPIKLITRDGGNAKPDEIVRQAEELVNRDGVKFLIGTIADNNSLALVNFAKQNKVFFIKGVNGSPKMTWQAGTKYFAKYGEPNYVFGGAIADASAKMEAKRWAFIGPDYEFGHSVIEEFKKALKKKQPDAVFVKDYFFPQDKLDAASAVQALKSNKVDGIFVALWGNDLVSFVRQGQRIRLFDKTVMAAAVLGQPENLNGMGKEMPMGWITQGWPIDDIEIPAHKKFVAAYRKTYKADPGYFSYVGYNAMKALAKAMNDAKTLTPEGVSDAIYGMKFDSTAGPLEFRKSDGQSTIGLWVGKTDMKNGKPAIVDWEYVDGAPYYPGDAYVKTVRPQE